MSASPDYSFIVAVDCVCSTWEWTNDCSNECGEGTRTRLGTDCTGCDATGGTTVLQETTCEDNTCGNRIYFMNIYLT